MTTFALRRLRPEARSTNWLPMLSTRHAATAARRAGRRPFLPAVRARFA